MKNKDKLFISICIPTYNRPNQLNRLLNSIDCKNNDNDIEIVIRENHAQKQNETRNIVNEFKMRSKYLVKYNENPWNFGYDRNIRELIADAEGEYIIYMGDDDIFSPRKLDFFIDFIRNNKMLGYILRSYETIELSSGKIQEKFFYYNGIKYFKEGAESYIELFRKSVFVSGFTFKREYALETRTNLFDDGGLYHLYIMAEICMGHPSAYYNEAFVQQIVEEKTYYEGGNSDNNYNEPGIITLNGMKKLINSYLEITNYMDQKHGTNSKLLVLKDMSKYSLPMLYPLREKGLKEFINYVKELKKIGLGCTFYFYIYTLGLVILGRSNCVELVRIIKNILGKTPKL